MMYREYQVIIEALHMVSLFDARWAISYNFHKIASVIKKAR